MTVGSLFAGIGGIEAGFLQAGFTVLWAIEKDKACCKTYSFNCPDVELAEKDIKSINPASLRRVDVITAGFPCQPFSLAGRQKGFSDPRGHLFYEVVRFAAALQPRFVFLENVPNLTDHDGGKTFLAVHNAFAEIGYSLRYRSLRSSLYGNVPQIRDRVYIIAFREQPDCDRFSYPEKIELTLKISDVILRGKRQHPVYYYSKDDPLYIKVCKVVRRKDCIYRVYHDSIKPVMNQMCPTLTASMGAAENQVPLVLDDYGVRGLTVHECLDFQGFPKAFRFPGTITLKDAYKQIGNSVSVPVVKRIAEKLWL